MRALPNQMSERVTPVGSCLWQARPLKANCQTFSIPISSSEGCHIRTFTVDEAARAKSAVGHALPKPFGEPAVDQRKKVPGFDAADRKEANGSGSSSPGSPS